MQEEEADAVAGADATIHLTRSRSCIDTSMGQRHFMDEQEMHPEHHRCASGCYQSSEKCRDEMHA